MITTELRALITADFYRIVSDMSAFNLEVAFRRFAFFALIRFDTDWTHVEPDHLSPLLTLIPKERCNKAKVEDDTKK